MSTIKADNIATLAGVSTSMANAVNGSAKAWVNFNGTGTVAIRASYNVSTITDNGTGDYTINFTTGMPDANYAVNGNYSWKNGVSAGGGLTVRNDTGYTPTSSICRVICMGQDGNYYDRDYVFVSIFR